MLREPQGRIEKTKKNTIYGFASKIILLVTMFASRIIFVRILDERYLGINGLFSNVLNVLSLADLGINTALMYSLYSDLAKKNEEHISALIHYFKKVYIAIAIAVAAIGVAIIPFLPKIINLKEPIDHIYVFYLLFLMKTVISYLFVYRSTLIMADQKNYVLCKYEIVFQVLTFIIQTIILVYSRNYILYLLSDNICRLLYNFFYNHIAYKMYPFLKLYRGNRRLENHEKKEIFENVKSLFMYRVCGVIQGNTDNILTSIFAGTVMVGYYSNYALVITGVVSMLTIVFNGVKASIGNLVFSENGKERAHFIFNVVEVVNYWIVGLCAIFILILAQDYILIAFGSSYLLGMVTVWMVVLNFYTSNIRQSIWAYRETTGIFRQTKYVTMVITIINLIFSLIGGYYWGINGILGATVLSGLVYGWKEPLVLYKEYLQQPAKEYFVHYICRFILLLVTYGATSAVCSLISLSSIPIQFLLKGLICFALVNIIFLIYFCKTKEFQYIYKNIIKIKIKK